MVGKVLADARRRGLSVAGSTPGLDVAARAQKGRDGRFAGRALVEPVPAGLVVGQKQVELLVVVRLGDVGAQRAVSHDEVDDDLGPRVISQGCPVDGLETAQRLCEREPAIGLVDDPTAEHLRRARVLDVVKHHKTRACRVCDGADVDFGQADLIGGQNLYPAYKPLHPALEREVRVAPLLNGLRTDQHAEAALQMRVSGQKRAVRLDVHPVLPSNSRGLGRTALDTNEYSIM